jgi:myo-inositol-1(or 4)-monophosphatase
MKKIEVINVMREASRAAGKILLGNFGKRQKISYKAVKNLVTASDKLSERTIINMIKKSFPSHAIMSEECGELSAVSEFKWIIDPLDGTTNYAHGLPIFTISLALEYKGDVIIGMVYNPTSDEEYFAVNGKGAWLNNRRIHVSKIRLLRDSLVVTGFPPDARENPDGLFHRFILFCCEAQAVRRIGSAALDLCWVASGKLDGFWESRLSPWDVAAGYLIVREAGGNVTNYSNCYGKIDDREVVASNGLIHDEMIRVVQNKDDLNHLV